MVPKGIKKVQQYQKQYEEYAEKYGLDSLLNEESAEPAAAAETQEKDKQGEEITTQEKADKPSPSSTEKAEKTNSAETKK